MTPQQLAYALLEQVQRGLSLSEAIGCVSKVHEFSHRELMQAVALRPEMGNEPNYPRLTR